MMCAKKVEPLGQRSQKIVGDLKCVRKAASHPLPVLGTPRFFCSHMDPLMGLLGTVAPQHGPSDMKSTIQGQLSPGTTSISIEPPGVGCRGGGTLRSLQLCEGLLGPGFFSRIQFSNPCAHHWLQTLPAGQDCSDPDALRRPEIGSRVGSGLHLRSESLADYCDPPVYS